MTERSIEEKLAILETLPPATTKICNDCPWRRAAVPGWLGPMTAEEWIDIVHSDAPIACHQTIRHDNVDDAGHGKWDDGVTRQCLGSAVYRANVMKSPRHPNVARAEMPDYVNVFSWDNEFLDHHNGSA